MGYRLPLPRDCMALRSENFLLRRYIEKAMVDLPALPSVVMQVIQATEKETVSTSEIEKLLASDPAITAKLLKVVNSAYFGLPRQIVNVNQTIAILGLLQVRNLVMSIGVLNVLNSPSPRIIDVQKHFWQHSFAAASCAETLARTRNRPRKVVEMIFVGGLLHDVGRLFLFTLFNLPYQEVIKESLKKEEPLAEVENRILGTTHAGLGGMLADKWNFPQCLVDMIKYHDSFPEGCVDESLYFVHVADAIANELAPAENIGIRAPISLRAIDALNLSEEELNQLREQTSVQLELAQELLGVM